MKFRRDRSKGKVMLEVFFDSQGIVHYEFIPEGRTVNKEMYVEILRRLRDAIRRKRPDKWAQKNWLLLHDNAPSHRSLLVKQYLAKHGVTTLEHPPYSPDLAPCDFYLFPRIKNAISRAPMKLKVLRYPRLPVYRKPATRSVSRSYTGVGRSASLPKDSTLKEMLFKFLYSYCNSK